MRLARGVCQLGTDGHVAEFGIQHLFLGVRQAVLLLGRLVARQDIEKHHHNNQSDEGILFPESTAAELVAIQPRLYVMYVGHYFFSAMRSLALRLRGLRSTSSAEASRPFSISVNGLRLFP